MEHIHPLAAGLLIMFLVMVSPFFTRISNRAFGVLLLASLALVYAGCYVLVHP